MYILILFIIGVVMNPKLADAWILYYLFELQQKNEAKLPSILKEMEDAEPK